jgi:hypothetical protein
MRSRVRLYWTVVASALGLALGVIPGAAHAAYPSNGTFMGAVHFSDQCTSGLGVGVAFDGTNLWYTCYGGAPDLLRADPTTGVVSAVYNIDGGLGAIAYDATRNAIWAAPGGPNSGAIWLINLDASRNVTSSGIRFNAGGDANGLDDGIGFDATDDTLYFKPDNSSPIHHYDTNGNKLGDITGAVSCNGPDTSGLAIGGDLLFEGKDGCSHVFVVDKHTLAPAFDFSTQVAGDPNFRDEGLTCDNRTFAPVDVMWSKEAYSPMRASAFAIPQGTCGVGGRPAEQPISPQGTTFTSTEGKAVSGTVATFTDPDPSSTAAEYNATIDWGDGSPSSAGTITGPQGGPYTVSGAHTYAEEGTYRAAVTITDADTPSNTATASSTANVSDAALAASPACPATSTQSFNGTTATFADAASPYGTLSDFSAAIDWGDGSSSTATVSGPDGGPYSVSGSHSYTTTGTVTITTKVKDVGGSTASASCKTLVFAFAPGGGSFVVGNRSAVVGNPVTFWGAQWWKDNALSGGSAPASFKGFAENPNAPSCGASWSTDPGSSTPPPPGPLPAYMGVIVSSHATKNGSEIAGDIVHIAVVHTNPGYQPDPGHAGAGTVVAMVC